MSVCFASGLLLHGRRGGRYELDSGNELTDQNENVEYSSAENAKPGLGSELSLSPEDKELICSWALMSEKIMHGTPSGKYGWWHC